MDPFFFMCCKHKGSINHLFVECPWVKAVWFLSLLGRDKCPLNNWLMGWARKELRVAVVLWSI